MKVSKEHGIVRENVSQASGADLRDSQGGLLRKGPATTRSLHWLLRWRNRGPRGQSLYVSTSHQGEERLTEQLETQDLLDLGFQKFQAIFRAAHFTVATRGRPGIVPKAVPLFGPHCLSF